MNSFDSTGQPPHHHKYPHPPSQELREYLDPFQTIEECQPWPEHPADPAQTLRAAINSGMRHATDEALEAVFEAAGELATTAGAGHGSTESWIAQSWITGAAFAYGTVFCRLLDKMPLTELRELIEDIADEVAPQWEDDHQ